jgi:hypothetical protein
LVALCDAELVESLFERREPRRLSDRRTWLDRRCLSLSVTAVPVCAGPECAGVLLVESHRLLRDEDLKFLSGFAWLSAQTWRLAAASSRRRARLATEEAFPTSETAILDLGRAGRTGSRWKAPPDPTASAESPPRRTGEERNPAAPEVPPRCFALLEGQVRALRRRLIDQGRLDPRAHDELVELSLVTRALSFLFGAEAPRPQLIDLALHVRQTLGASALADQRCRLGALPLERIELDAPPEVLGLIVDLLSAAARRLFVAAREVAVEVTRRDDDLSARPVAAAEVRLHAADGSHEGLSADATDPWSHPDVALALARQLAENVLGGKLHLDVGARRVALVIPLSRL